MSAIAPHRHLLVFLRSYRVQFAQSALAGLLDMSAKAESNQLKAAYSSPTGKQTFESPLSPITDANRSTQEKTAYLSDLRAKTSKLQDDINAFLTQKMEEDKTLQASSGQKAKVDEDKEEMMYGEEDPEEDG